MLFYKTLKRSMKFTVKLLLCTSLISSFEQLSLGLKSVKADYKNYQVPGMQLRLEQKTVEAFK